MFRANIERSAEMTTTKYTWDSPHKRSRDEIEFLESCLNYNNRRVNLVY